MLFKKLISSFVMTGLLAASGCAREENASETKFEPTTTFAAMQTAVAIVQAIWERNNAVTQSDINNIIGAMRAIAAQLAAHADRLHIQTEVATVNGLADSFERYARIRANSVELNDLLLATERSFNQIESIFANQRVYDSHLAAQAYNTIAAIRLVADMDYMHDMGRVRALARRVAAVNNRLLASPSFPVYTSDANGGMRFANCKVMTAPFTEDQRDHIFYSALSQWSMGYHKGHEFRYYHAGRYTGYCLEDKAGNNAFRIEGGGEFMRVVYNWEGIAPRMYNDNINALKSNESYRATRTANEAMQPLVGSFAKHGNNGTVSCNTYCNGAEWGRTGSCLSGLITKDDTIVSCSELPGLLQEGGLLCQCLE